MSMTSVLFLGSIFSLVNVAAVYAAEDVVTVRFADADSYEAPGHFKMEAYGLQGGRFNTPAAVSIGMSVFHSGGGTENAESSRSSFYLVVEGEMTVVRDEGDIVLGQYDSIYIPGGLKRGLMNNGDADAKMLVLSPSTPITSETSVTEPVVVRAKDATSYEAPGHFKMEAYGLQGSRFNTPADVNVSLSVFHSGGGTEVSSGANESLYMVVDGELTIARPEGDITLNQYDSIYIASGVTRGIMNNSGSDVKMLVFSPGVSGGSQSAGGSGSTLEKVSFTGQDVISAKEIFGLWETSFQGSGAVMNFKEDGTLAMASNIESLESSPNYTGWYWFVDGTFNFSDSVCSSVGTYKLKMQKGAKDKLALEAIEDACGDGRIGDLTTGMVRIDK
jgi:glyoxylate utilization-related uncharacterized protein